ncbi:glycosyltransferase family 2 protein [Pseudodonghicola flavimaris]|uniref:Glycosyltransferase family 2 protein n=1 Tax=Pseudodonghicola flavimaris TaxID=3050036 RepID=A0ABT7F1F5_9RHOB|nr:glycosyltransferase family 2 protein [Pseudodonghicola flavimaris]MDK3018424.1 glycosyltransferase family 2 protein [Pseudodonghicola flavimaris]
MTLPRLSCILPAYNEAPRLGRVLDVTLAAPQIDEVIVIDDGSTDETAAIATARTRDCPRLRVIRQPRNGGKTRAVAEGLRTARGTFVMFLDSDLTGLTPAHLSQLSQPVLSGAAGASLSLRGNAPALWQHLGLDYISGERVMPRALMMRELAALDRLPRFGLEVFMNRLWLEADLAIAVVPWPDVASPMKFEKYGPLAGVKADVGMIRDIFTTIGAWTALQQIRGLRRHRIGPVTA